VGVAVGLGVGVLVGVGVGVFVGVGVGVLVGVGVTVFVGVGVIQNQKEQAASALDGAREILLNEDAKIVNTKRPRKRKNLNPKAFLAKYFCPSSGFCK